MNALPTTLFVLTQEPLKIEAVKNSVLGRIFSNIVFIEDELFMNSECALQPVDKGSFIISSVKILNFVKNMHNKEVLKDITPENTYILALETFLHKVLDTDDVVYVAFSNLYNSTSFTTSFSQVAKLPKIYVNMIRKEEPVLLNTKDASDNKIMLGYNKKIDTFIAENENCSEDKWVERFNNFTNLEQLVNSINALSLKNILAAHVREYKDNDTVYIDTISLLSNNVHRNMLKLEILKMLDNKKFNYVVAKEGEDYIFGVFVSDLLNIPFIPIRKESSNVPMLLHKNNGYTLEAFKDLDNSSVLVVGSDDLNLLLNSYNNITITTFDLKTLINQSTQVN